LFQLRWTDIDFLQHEIVIRGDYAKSGKTRYVPLNDEAFTVLCHWRPVAERSDWVFPNGNDGPLTSVRSSWKRVLQSACVSDFRWHDLRHHFASSLVMKGVDLNTVRELLGHSDLAMTLRYAHLSPEHKAEAVARLCVSEQTPATAPIGVVAGR
jgi:integrase